LRFTRRAQPFGLQNSDRLEGPITTCSITVDEAAPIFVRFYISTSRRPWRIGLKRSLESNSQPCSPPACTVLSIANRSAVRFATRLPDIRFRRIPDRCFLTRRGLFSRSGPDARDGLLLARNGFRVRGLHSRVKAPDLPLHFPASRFVCPFGLSAPLPDPVRPVSGRFVASGPLQSYRLA